MQEPVRLHRSREIAFVSSPESILQNVLLQALNRGFPLSRSSNLQPPETQQNRHMDDAADPPAGTVPRRKSQNARPYNDGIEGEDTKPSNFGQMSTFSLLKPAGVGIHFAQLEDLGIIGLAVI